jgi:hypothetical protein
MPKTLAALPSSQYPTMLEVLLGKKRFDLAPALPAVKVDVAAAVAEVAANSAVSARQVLAEKCLDVMHFAGPDWNSECAADLCREDAHLEYAALAVCWSDFDCRWRWQSKYRLVSVGASVRSMRMKLLPACMVGSTCSMHVLERGLMGGRG